MEGMWTILFVFLAVLFFSCGESVKQVALEENKDDTQDIDTVNVAKVTDTSELSQGKEYFYIYQTGDSIFTAKDIENGEFLTKGASRLDMDSRGEIAAISKTLGGKKIIDLINIKDKTSKKLQFDFDIYMGDFVGNTDYLAIKCFDGKFWKTAFYNLKTEKLTFADCKNNIGDIFGTKTSPTGKYIIVHDMQYVYLLEFNEGNTKPLKIFHCQDFCESDFGFSSENCFQIDNNAQKIVYTVENYNYDTLPRRSLAVYDVKTSNVKLIFSEDASVENFKLAPQGDVYYSVNTPQGKSMIYLYRPSQNLSVKLREFDTDGKFNFSVAQ